MTSDELRQALLDEGWTQSKLKRAEVLLEALSQSSQDMSALHDYDQLRLVLDCELGEDLSEPAEGWTAFEDAVIDRTRLPARRRPWQNMLLAAHGVGLGACWVSAFLDEQMVKVLDLDENVTAMGVITLGYADEQPKMPLKYTLHDKVFFNTYREKSKDEAEVFATYSKNVKSAIDIAKKWAEDALKKIRKVE